MGLVPTGHTFTVGSETCIGCHQDTVHTRDTIVKLSGQVEGVPEVETETLKQQVAEQAHGHTGTWKHRALCACILAWHKVLLLDW